MPEKLQDADIRRVCVEIIRKRTHRAAQDEIHRMRAAGKTAKRKVYSGEVPKARAVNSERGKAYAADEYDDMRSVKSEHAGQKKRVPAKRRLRKHERHDRSERSDKKRESRYRAAPGEKSYRDEEHIYVAELEGQFVPPVKAHDAAYAEEIRIVR